MQKATDKEIIVALRATLRDVLATSAQIYDTSLRRLVELTRVGEMNVRECVFCGAPIFEEHKKGCPHLMNEKLRALRQKESKRRRQDVRAKKRRGG